MELNRKNLKCHLRAAVDQLQVRGLQKAATWTLEQIAGITGSGESVRNRRVDPFDRFLDETVDKLMLARSFLDAGEYQRCAYYLQSNTPSNKDFSDPNAKSIHLFLSSYARYMAGEKLKDQLRAEVSPLGASEPETDPNATKAKVSTATTTGEGGGAGQRGTAATNRNLPSLYSDLLPVYTQGAMDGFVLYIFAVVVRDLHRHQGVAVREILATMKEKHCSSSEGEEEMSHCGRGQSGTLTARQLFIEAIRAYPWNW